jgi:hypothetical protein
MRNPVAYLALFFALTGTGLAAGRALTGEDVANGSLSAADFRRHDLRARDLPASAGGRPGLRGPQGPEGPRPHPPGPGSSGPVFDYFHATFDREGHQVDGPGAFRFTHPAPGVYCSPYNQPFIFVQSLEADPQLVAADSTGDEPCPPDTYSRVAVFARDGTPADGSFFIITG